MKQKGFAPLLILIALAVAVVVGAVVYGLFITKQQAVLPGKTTLTSEESTVRTVPLPPIQASTKVGTPECPELDYTGCDTSGEFMTWKDDSESTIILK